MHVEHLIQVNDLALSTEVLHRAMVNTGLALRARLPEWANDQITACDWHEPFAANESRTRTISMGTRFHFDETVLWTPNHSLAVQVHANADQAGGSLTITIEEPETDHVFLRFVYDIPMDETLTEQGVNVAAYVKQAYLDVDLAFVKKLREFAQTPVFALLMDTPDAPVMFDDGQCQLLCSTH